MSPSGELLQHLIEQVDEKHMAAHSRIRRDLIEGFADVGRELEAVTQGQRADHETLVRQEATRERRKDLNGYKAIIVAAAIGGGFRLIEVIITQTAALLKP